MPTQIVATLGPASWSLVPALRAAGATAFRLNASHLDPVALRTGLSTLRRDAPQAGVVVDLQGAKMRLGRFAPRDVARGERVTFSVEGATGLPLPHPEFFTQAHAGDTVTMDDARVRLRVVACGDGRLDAQVEDAGCLHPRKGVNLLEHPVALDGLTAADHQAIVVSRAFGVREFAFSFMLDGREADWVRAEAPGCRVVGKVERREAADALAAIADRVEVVWICRGDLGAQLGSGALARFVASVTPRSVAVPVLMAGQVLEHLTQHSTPTRSEVCHLFDLAERGYAGVVLSDETAIGADPVRAVQLTASLLADFQEQRRR